MKMKMKMKMKTKMNKPMRNMLITLGTLFALIIGYHFVSGLIQKHQLEKDAKAPIAVSTTIVSNQDWQSHLFAIGNLFAKDGIDVASQVDGIISKILIVSNKQVKTGDPIVQLDATPDIAALESLQAQADLARLIYERSKEQFSFNAVSKQQLEIDEYNMRMLKAQAAQQKAIVELKTIRAAFDGQVGISKLSPGMFISAGDPIISLQALDILYVYFYLPEQHFSNLQVGQDVTLRTDTYINKSFPGKISAIDPLIDSNTHNVQLEATIENPNIELLPGMYTQIEVIIGKPESRLTIPQSAVSYNPYGNYVYVVQKDKKKLYVKQRFITLGETRGDQITVVKGLQAGDEIVSSGQLKLKNETHIVINNKIEPTNDAAPKVIDE